MYADYQIGELCTPTGSASKVFWHILWMNMPVKTPTKVSMDLARNNLKDLIVFAPFVEINNDSEDTIIEMSCNLDDMTPEEMGTEQLLLSPALDVLTTSIMMKTTTWYDADGPCKEGDMDKRDLIFRHTTSLGIRYHRCERYILSRSAGDID